MSDADTLELLPVDALLIRPAAAVRAELRRPVVEAYAEAMREGAQFPPVLVVRDGSELWLCDGAHRLVAHRMARPGEPIACLVRPGDELEAIRVALTANGAHGLRRSGNDLRRAFEAAVARDLVDPSDAAAVADVLRCSRAAAFRLTESHRDDAKAQRDARIRELLQHGRSQREIASELGVDQATVGRVMQKSPETFASPPRGERHGEPGERGAAPVPRHQPGRTIEEPVTGRPPPPAAMRPPPPPDRPPATFDVLLETGAAEIRATLARVRDLRQLNWRKAAAVMSRAQLQELRSDAARAQKVLAELSRSLGDPTSGGTHE